MDERKKAPDSVKEWATKWCIRGKPPIASCDFEETSTYFRYLRNFGRCGRQLERIETNAGLEAA